MQILLFSDFHNAVDYDVLKQVLSSRPTSDAAFTLGDISSSDLKYIKSLIPETPIFGVCGNHDTSSGLELAGIPNIHGKVIDVGGLRFTGFGGSVRYKRGLYTMFSQSESMSIGKALPVADILLSHDRAFCGDRPDLTSALSKNPHEGLAGITYYLRNTPPLLHIHGHIHENKRYMNERIDTLSVYGVVAMSLDIHSIKAYEVLITP